MTQSEILERLKNYLPPNIYEEILDMQELLSTESYEISDLWNEIENVLNNAFIDTLTLEGIGRWESILGITSAGSSLADRRSEIATKLFTSNKGTFSLLRSIAEVYGELEDITFNGTTSTVEINFSGATATEGLFVKVRQVVPSHLLIEIQFTTSNAVIALEESIYGTQITRTLKAGTWQVGVTPIATDSGEVQYK